MQQRDSLWFSPKTGLIKISGLLLVFKTTQQKGIYQDCVSKGCLSISHHQNLSSEIISKGNYIVPSFFLGEQKAMPGCCPVFHKKQKKSAEVSAKEKRKIKQGKK